MKGVDRYFDNYNPCPDAAPGTYRAEYFLPNLEHLMEIKGLKQADVAHKCGLTPPMVYNWLAGKSEPSLYSFTRVCEGLEIEPNWLLAKHTQIKRKKDANENEKSTTAGAGKG